jgi:uncharacterized protein YukE
MSLCKSNSTIDELQQLNEAIQKLHERFTKTEETLKQIHEKFKQNDEKIEKLEKEILVHTQRVEAEEQKVKAEEQKVEAEIQKAEAEIQTAEITFEKTKEEFHEDIESLNEVYAEIAKELLKVPENMPICKALIDESEKTDNRYKCTAYYYAATKYATYDYPLFSEKGYKELQYKMWNGPCKGTAKFVFNIIAAELTNRKIKENKLVIFPPVWRDSTITKERLEILKSVINGIIEFKSMKRPTNEALRKFYTFPKISRDHSDAYIYYTYMHVVEAEIYLKAAEEYQV